MKRALSMALGLGALAAASAFDKVAPEAVGLSSQKLAAMFGKLQAEVNQGHFVGASVQVLRCVRPPAR
jgi:hypothetical protein